MLQEPCVPWETPVLPTSPQPSLELWLEEFSVLLPSRCDAALPLQVRIPSRVDKPGSSPVKQCNQEVRGAARGEELPLAAGSCWDPAGILSLAAGSCWDPLSGLGSECSQQFHSRLCCLWSHTALPPVCVYSLLPLLFLGIQALLGSCLHP